jgi:hypothetical protein
MIPYHTKIGTRVKSPCGGPGTIIAWDTRPNHHHPEWCEVLFDKTKDRKTTWLCNRLELKHICSKCGDVLEDDPWNCDMCPEYPKECSGEDNIGKELCMTCCQESTEGEDV